MCLSDTAEYWWDVKKRTNKKLFTHLKGFDYGHFHVHETNKLIQVDCYTCLKRIENTPELKKRLEQSKESLEKQKFRFGKCECGAPIQERVNKITNQKFLGCTQYPKCKRTKNI